MKLKLMACGFFFFSMVLFGSAMFNLQQDEDKKLAKFFDGMLEDEFKLRPMVATQLGDHRFDDKLENPSGKNRELWKQFYKSSLEKLRSQIKLESLSTNGKVDFKVLESNLERTLWLQEFNKTYETDPRAYNELIADSLYLPLSQSTIPEEKIVAALIARVALVPKVLQSAKESIKNPPKVILNTAIKQNLGSIRFYKKGIAEFVKNPDLKTKLLEATIKVVPSLESYQDFLQDLAKKGVDSDWRIGKEQFKLKLVHELQVGIDADELLRLAELEMVTVTHEMYVIARQLWSGLYPGKVLPVTDFKGKNETIAKVLEKLSVKRGNPQDLLKDTRSTVKKIQSFITAKNILTLPQPDRCQILEMPEFQRGNSVAYLNQAPPLDTNASSVYAISPPPSDWDANTVLSFMKEYNSYMLQILTIHEAYPGHYVQLEYSNKHPSKIRRVLSSGVFAEGWAVYTEKMMLDEGYGDQDPGLRIHQLKWYLRAVANAVLDYQMHCNNMTDEQALDLLVNRAFQTQGEALGKIIRSKQSSCQLSTYFAGAVFFNKLRADAQNAKGEAFNLKQYHEAVLSHGTLPLNLLRDLVWVDLGLKKIVK